MSKKHTVSLQEFFKSHGTPSIHENLPVRPRCDRDADQGLHLRLAQNCSLDSGKSYPQRHGPGKEGQYAEYDSYGSSDGAPVGDVDYHRPNSHHAPAGPYHSSGSSSNSHHARRQVPPPHSSSRHDWSAQYSSEHPGAGAQPRGPVMPAGMAPPGAGPLGPRVHPGSLGTYGPVPSYGPPPQHLYGPPGGYGVPPQHIHGPPAGVYGGRPDAAPAHSGQDGFAGLQHGPGPVASGYGGHAPPYVLEHPISRGAGGHGVLPPMYAVPPPPPPPPRQLPQQQVVVQGPPVVPSSVGSYAPAPEGSTPAAPTQKEARAADTAPIRKVTPFAEPAPAPGAPSEPPAPVCPKNEFAERLAARALASAARAKSSLLAGGGGGGSSALSAASSLSRADSVSGAAGKPPAGCGALEVPVGMATGACVDSSASSPSEQSGVFVKPSHPFGRPKLALKPRSVLVDTAANGSYSSTSSDSGDAPADHGSTTGSTASSANGGRPRLHLLPRGSSLTDSASAGAAGARKPSVFGEAKPREEVLKGRGLDPSLVDAAVEIGRKQHDSAPAGQGSAADRASHASYTSRAEDEWHTVAGHGRKGAAARQEQGMPELDAFDPFFGSSSGSIAAKPSSREYVSVPPPRAFSHDIMRDGYGGRHGGGFSSRSNRVDVDGNDDAGVFGRALPTRQVPLAL